MGALSQEGLREPVTWSEFKEQGLARMDQAGKSGRVVIFPVLFSKRGRNQTQRDFTVNADVSGVRASFTCDKLRKVDPKKFPPGEFKLLRSDGKVVALVSEPRLVRAQN